MASPVRSREGRWLYSQTSDHTLLVNGRLRCAFACAISPGTVLSSVRAASPPASIIPKPLLKRRGQIDHDDGAISSGSWWVWARLALTRFARSVSSEESRDANPACSACSIAAFISSAVWLRLIASLRRAAAAACRCCSAASRCFAATSPLSSAGRPAASA